MAKAQKKDFPTTSDPRGMKRICMECSVRFFDMNNRPIKCPSCGAEFTGEVKVKARKGRAAAGDDTEGQVDKKTAKAASSDDDDEDEEEDDGTEIVSLEDLETPSKSDDDDITVNLDGDDSDDDDDNDLDDDDIGSLDELEPDAEIEDEDED